MTRPAEMVEIRRGPFRESVHLGHAVVAHASGRLEAVWGDPRALILPRSSIKMIQALPLIETGAASDLGPAELALACASHTGAAVHVAGVRAWLRRVGIDENELRCGAQPPRDQAARTALARDGRAPDPIHNNCSGKHAGFLTVAQHLGAGADYVAPDHPVQRAVRDALETLAGEPSPGHGIDGCGAPNFALTLTGLARAMARFGDTPNDSVRGRAKDRLREAMLTHPTLISGEGAADADLIRAGRERVIVKTGAEGVYAAILPARSLGVALKIVDGATRASEAAIAALLVHLGAFDGNDPAVRTLYGRPLRNWNGETVGVLRLAPGFPSGPATGL